MVGEAVSVPSIIRPAAQTFPRGVRFEQASFALLPVTSGSAGCGRASFLRWRTLANRPLISWIERGCPDEEAQDRDQEERKRTSAIRGCGGSCNRLQRGWR